MPKSEKTVRGELVVTSPGSYVTTHEQDVQLREREGLVHGRKGGISAAHYGEKERVPDSGTGTKIKNGGGV